MKVITLFLLMVCAQALTAQEIEVMNYDQLQKHLGDKNSKVQVVNFWATWCKPCVEEMPGFDDLVDKYAHNELDVLMVSLDFPEQVNKRLKTFVKKKGVKGEVVLLDDLDMNRWINLVDPSWSGAIPATLIIKGQKRWFIEGVLTKEALHSKVENIITQ